MFNSINRFIFFVTSFTSLIDSRFVYTNQAWSENKPPGFLNQAIKDDTPEVQSYQWESNNYPDLFELIQDNDRTGAKIAKIKVKKMLDREDPKCHNDRGECVYPIRISAMGNSGVLDTTSFDITISDQNDNKPIIANEVGKVYEVVENLQDKVVIQLNVKDADFLAEYGEKSIVYYPIKNLVQYNRDGTETQLDDGDVANYFQIDASGAVRTASNSKIDAEQVLKYTMNIKVRDGGKDNEGWQSNDSKIYKATIAVKDANDNPPKFTAPTVDKYQVGELAQADYEIGKIKVTDTDVDLANRRTEFIVQKHSEIFKVLTSNDDQTTGTIFVKKAGLMDFESNIKEYTIQIKAVNQNNQKLSDTTQITIAVLDENEPPVFKGPEKETKTTTENDPNGQVSFQIEANDLDTLKNPKGRAQQVSYKVKDDPNNWWKIDAETGLLELLPPVDREAPQVNTNPNPAFYDVKVEACDNYYKGEACAEKRIRLKINDINDNAPQFFIDDQYKTSMKVSVCFNVGQKYDEVDISGNQWYDLNVEVPVVDRDSTANGGPFRVILKDGTPKADQFLLKKVEGREAGNVNKEIWKLYTKIYKLPYGEGDGIKLHVEMEDANGKKDTRYIQLSTCNCGSEQACETAPLVQGGSTWVIVVIIALVVLLTVIFIIILVWTNQKRKQPPMPMPQDNGYSTIVKYQGGAPMEDIDIDNAPLIPHPKKKIVPDHPPENISEFIRTAKEQADNDPSAPPYDSLLTFDYEGQGSTAGSLSSLCSATTDQSVDYNYLHEWGPRFQKLAEIYAYEED